MYNRRTAKRRSNSLRRLAEIKMLTRQHERGIAKHNAKRSGPCQPCVEGYADIIVHFS